MNTLGILISNAMLFIIFGNGDTSWMDNWSAHDEFSVDKCPWLSKQVRKLNVNDFFVVSPSLVNYKLSKKQKRADIHAMTIYVTRG